MGPELSTDGVTDAFRESSNTNYGWIHHRRGYTGSRLFPAGQCRHRNFPRTCLVTARRKERDLLKINAVFLMCLLQLNALVFAAESPTTKTRNAIVVQQTPSLPARGAIQAVAARAIPLAQLEALATQAGGTQGKRSGGHPVLIGTIVGAGVGAVLGALGTSCSVSDSEARASGFTSGPCGSHIKRGGAILGAGLGAGIGALIGLAFRH
jgi:hypothetical protein